MMKLIKNKKIIWGTLAFVLLSFNIKTEVISLETKENTFYINEKKFELSWIHSVEKEEWIEMYELKENELYLNKTLFKTFGAGVPYDEKETKIENGYVSLKIDRIMNEINLVVSNNVKTKLITKNKVINLYELTENYENVLIENKKINLWQYIRGEFL